MICARCGTDLRDDWAFCPKCGARKGGDPADIMGRDFFSQLLESFKGSFKDTEEMEKAIQRTMESMGRGSGGQGQRPLGPFKIEIKTTRRPPPGAGGGPDKRKSVVPMLLDGNGRPRKPGSLPEARGDPEEPKADVRKMDGITAVNLSLPGVRSAEDVWIKVLDSSVEVRADAGERSYFKIVGKPPEAKRMRQSFADGLLRMEFS